VFVRFIEQSASSACASGVGFQEKAIAGMMMAAMTSHKDKLLAP
jgi:hypothetical protein